MLEEIALKPACGRPAKNKQTNKKLTNEQNNSIMRSFLHQGQRDG